MGPVRFWVVCRAVTTYPSITRARSLAREVSFSADLPLRDDSILRDVREGRVRVRRGLCHASERPFPFTAVEVTLLFSHTSYCDGVESTASHEGLLCGALSLTATAVRPAPLRLEIALKTWACLQKRCSDWCVSW